MFFNSFDNKLKTIIRKGDSSPEYRNLFAKIVKIHRECFTEENLPTTTGYLEDLLYSALMQHSRSNDRLELPPIKSTSMVSHHVAKQQSSPKHKRKSKFELISETI